jgi:hypothetical protein
MVNSLSIQMLEASDPTAATIQSVKQAVAHILKSEAVPFQSETEKLSTEAAVQNLKDGLQQLRIVDVALPLRDFAEKSNNVALREAVFTILEDIVDSNSPDLNHKIVDHLALASIYEGVYEEAAAEFETVPHELLGKEMHHHIKQVVGRFEEVQKYYPQKDHKADDFTFTILQMQALDQLLIKNTELYLEPKNKRFQTDEISERLIRLLQKIENTDLAATLTHSLEATQIPAQKSLDLGL